MTDSVWKLYRMQITMSRQPHPCDIRAVADVGVVGPWEEPLLIVLDLYWKMSCSLDSLSCPAWSDCLCCLGDRGEKSDVVGDTGVAGEWFDSSSVKDTYFSNRHDDKENGVYWIRCLLLRHSSPGLRLLC